MSLQTSSMRPVCSAVAGFLGVVLVVMMFGLANKIGIIDTDLTKRGIGLAIGLMLVIIGNYLPKLRPLNWTRANASSIANERLSGWILVLTGIAWIAFFTFAPLGQARHVSSLIAISALTMIALNWTRLVRKAFFDVRRQGDGTSFRELLAGPGKIIGYLLFAFFFVVITSCVKFLIDEKQLTDNLTSWMLLVFGILYAGLFAILESTRARK
jgi:hypothetical protein